MELNTGEWNVYQEYKRLLGLGQINNTLHTFKLALIKFTYVPNLINQRYWSEISNHELVAHSYPQGGATIPLKQWLRDDNNNSVVWSANQVDFNLQEIVNVKYLVIYNNTAVNKPLVCWSFIDANETDVQGLRFRIHLQEGIYKLI